MIIWAAGFMDGEGTITLKRIRRKGTIYYQPYITCAQTVRGKEAIVRLKNLFGGSIYEYLQKGFRDDTLQWTVASQKALNCARKLLPYLILKNRQAELLIQFYEMDIFREEQYRLSNKTTEQRERLFQEMRKLNVKGKLRLQRLSEEAPMEMQ